jgi:xylulokinase
MTAVLALDLGTSGAKAALIGADGGIAARGSAPYATAHPPGGGAEQDPQDWLRSARDAIGQCLHAAEAGAAPPAALCLTGQMQDLVLLPSATPATPTAAGDAGRHGGALRPALLYSDTRAQAEAAHLRDRLPDWDARIGSRQDATSCAAMWLRLERTEQDTTRRAHGIVLGPAGFLAWTLGCGAWCDATTASAAGLLGTDGRWERDVCAAAGLPEPLLPSLTEAAGQGIGRTDARAQTLLGLPAGLPVVLAPGDAGATTLGLVGLGIGADYAYLGTTGWLARVVGPEDVGGADAQDEALADAAASHRLALPGTEDRLAISAVLAAGEAAAWAREAFLGGVGADRADALLEEREVRTGRGPTGLLAIPALHGERFPVRAPGLRAAVIGMDARTRGIDVYAAVLEGVAHALAHALPPAEPGARGAPLIVTGGGAASAPWLRILADVTGRPVLRIPLTDAALHGCALAGAQARGHEMPLGSPPETPGRREAPGCPEPLGSSPGLEPIAPDPDAVLAHARLHPTHRRLYELLPDLPARP